MSVRGTTHARHHKKIIIREGEAEGGKILCAWADCDNDALALFVLRVHDHFRPGFGPPSKYGFCCQRHLEYFAHSHRAYGRLPAGSRGTIL